MLVSAHNIDMPTGDIRQVREHCLGGKSELTRMGVGPSRKLSWSIRESRRDTAVIGMASGRLRGAGTSLRARSFKNNEQGEKVLGKGTNEITPLRSIAPVWSQPPGSGSERLALDLTAYAGVSKESARCRSAVSCDTDCIRVKRQWQDIVRALRTTESV